VTSYPYDGQIYEPLPVDFLRPQCLRLPSAIRPCESLESLFVDLVRVLMQYTTLDKKAAWVLACFCIATWFAAD
jgi:hypothetical protein